MYNLGIKTVLYLIRSCINGFDGVYCAFKDA